MILKGTVAILVVVSLQALVISDPARSTLAQVYHRGMYRNHIYGYSLAVPSGLVGITDPAPAPQHGIMIPLSDDSKEQIWIDGSYNAALWSTTEDAMNEHIDWLRKEADGVIQSSRQKIRLGRFIAIRDVTHYDDRATGEAMVQDLTLAMRNAKGEGEILYTIGLRTRKLDYEKHKPILNDVIKGWRTESLPKSRKLRQEKHARLTGAGPAKLHSLHFPA